MGRKENKYEVKWAKKEDGRNTQDTETKKRGKDDRERPGNYCTVIPWIFDYVSGCLAGQSPHMALLCRTTVDPTPALFMHLEKATTGLDALCPCLSSV